MFSDPVKNLKQFGLKEDMIVADLGAGTGFYSIAAAKMVPRGKVYSIEIQKDFLNSIKNKAIELDLNNLECFLGDVEKKGGTQIKDKIVDAVIASNVFFQIENKNKFIEEISRILKDDGSVLLIDLLNESSVLGSKLRETVPEEKLKQMFEEKGFVFDRKIDAGKHHYGIILRKLK
ncbi:MAG: class I SAM-dependent methyltransferase [Patescibacteria group bacterium]